MIFRHTGFCQYTFGLISFPVCILYGLIKCSDFCVRLQLLYNNAYLLFFEVVGWFRHSSLILTCNCKCLCFCRIIRKYTIVMDADHAVDDLFKGRLISILLYTILLLILVLLLLPLLLLLLLLLLYYYCYIFENGDGRGSVETRANLW
jgi:hypothetical protein